MKRPQLVLGIVAGVVLLGIAVATQSQWRPSLNRALSGVSASGKIDPETPNKTVNGKDAEEDHGHSHEGEEGVVEVELSDAARKNLGLRLGTPEPQDHWRTVTIPGVINDLPGHSDRRVTTNVQGVITKVYAYLGQAVRPGEPLFDLEPTGELLATAQANLLKSLQDLELVDLEISRLQPLVDQGTLPRTRLLEKQYEKRRLESLRGVQTQELLVRGLSQQQVDDIVETKTLLRQFTIYVPQADQLLDGHETGSQAGSGGDIVQTAAQKVVTGKVVDGNLATESATTPELQGVYSIQQLDVFPGKLVQAGDNLCDLAIHTLLHIEGHAFQQDATLITRVLEKKWPITALIEGGEEKPWERPGLPIVFIDNVVDPAAGTFHFYLALRNEVAHDEQSSLGVTYRTWRFKPGQRVQLLVPIAHWTDRLVLPADAVVKEGPEAFVFRLSGGHFVRTSVAVEFEDSRTVVLAEKSGLKPNQVLALNQAYQLNLAAKRAQGGGGGGHDHHDHAH